METLITRTKYVSETISIVVDFSDLFSGEISADPLPSISITSYEGKDENPENLLYEGIEVHGKKLEQRFRLGIPGCTYEITFKAYSDGKVYEKTTYLAILPEVGSAEARFIPQHLTTWPYPRIETERRGVVEFQSLSAHRQWMPSVQDGPYMGHLSLSAFSLEGGSKSYSYEEPDTYMGHLSLQEFQVYGSSKSFSSSEDTYYTGNLALLEFHVYGDSQQYSHTENTYYQGTLSLDSFEVKT